MDVQEIIDRLKAAGDDPFDRALATLDIVLSDREPELRAAIEAAAVPHWFDREILAQLAGSGDILETLTQLPMVETFAARGGWNVHETSRLAIRRDLYNRQPDRFRELSAAAAKCFPGDSPHERVETLYHRLISSPVEGGQELADLCIEWESAGRFEALEALGQALDESLRHTAPPLPARAYCGIYLARISKHRVAVSEAERLLREALNLLTDASDDFAETSACDLLGDILVAQGRLPEALIEHRRAQAIRERTAEQDSNDVNSRNLSTGHNKIGGVEAAQGDLFAALKSYEASLAIRERLAKHDPDDTGSQRDLSISYENIGNIEVRSGNLGAALESYRAGLAIRDRLAKRDPDNTLWQRDRFVIYNDIGDVRALQGDLAAALESYQAGLSIAERLAKHDPRNTEWQRDLSVSHSRIGDLEARQGDLATALKSYQADIAIAERLAKHDPGNAEWQRDLSFTHWKMATTFKSLDQLAEALEHAQRSLAIDERLATLDPTNATWQKDVEVSRALVARLQAVQQ